jgi:hypothetical protein
MIIAVAGPYSANTADQRKINVDALNSTATQLLAFGHTPLIGINAALPVVEQLPSEDKYEAIMKISMAVVDACEAILLIAPIPGANNKWSIYNLKVFQFFIL